MTSIFTQVWDDIKTDAEKVVTAIETGVVDLKDEIAPILKTTISSDWNIAVTAIEQSSIGLAATNALSAVKADGGNLLEALPTIIKDIAGEISTLKSGGSGNVITGVESFAETLASAVGNSILAKFVATPVISEIVTAVTALV